MNNRIWRQATAAAVVSLGMLSVWAPSALEANPYIHLGRVTETSSIVTNQPYVHVEMYSQTQQLGPYGHTGSFVGLSVPHNRLLLDTGANSILITAEAAEELESNGIIDEGDFVEFGVAGSATLDVSAPYLFDYQGTDGITHTLGTDTGGVRILYSSSHQLGGASIEVTGIPGLVGMPAMVNRVTTMDMTPWVGVEDVLDLQPMGVTFADTPPADNGHRYSVALSANPQFHPEDGIPEGSPPGSPTPDWGDVTFLTAKTENVDSVASGNFLLDTGAQMTIISTDLAAQIGVSAADAIAWADVGGLGGTTQVPIVGIEKFILPTEQGVDLVWGDADNPPLVAILDIYDGIDGVLGVDILTSGPGLDFVESDPLDFENLGDPYVHKIHFDFRDLPTTGNGTMLLDLNPSLDNVIVPEPSTLVLLLMAAVAVGLGRRRAR